MARPRKVVAAADGLVRVVGAWPEVFTGLDAPAIVRAGETVDLPADVAGVLIDAGAANVAPTA